MCGTVRCSSCDLQFTKANEDYTIQCNDCSKWLHYYCSGLPTYQIEVFAKTNRKYTCKKCSVVKFCDDQEWSIACEIAIQRHKALLEQSCKAFSPQKPGISDPDTPISPRKSVRLDVTLSPDRTQLVNKPGLVTFSPTAPPTGRGGSPTSLCPCIVRGNDP